MPNSAQSPMARVEHAVERMMFQSRWLLLPFYVGLVLGLFMLMIHFWAELIHLLGTLSQPGRSDGILIEILRLIDLSLLANLVVIVILSGYESFVSRIMAAPEERPMWMGKIDFTGLKVALMGSLAAISGIYLLEAMIGLRSENWVAIAWKLAIHLTFVISALAFAFTRKIEHGAEHATD